MNIKVIAFFVFLIPIQSWSSQTFVLLGRILPKISVQSVQHEGTTQLGVRSNATEPMTLILTDTHGRICYSKMYKPSLQSQTFIRISEDRCALGQLTFRSL